MPDGELCRAPKKCKLATKAVAEWRQAALGIVSGIKEHSGTRAVGRWAEIVLPSHAHTA